MLKDYLLGALITMLTFLYKQQWHRPLDGIK